MVKKTEGNKRNEESFRFIVIIQATLLFVALSLINKFEPANCESKDFDWSELGVALSNPKSALSNNASNNYRILVSPQRRMTKNYEFDYTNGSQPVSNGETTYVIPGSGSSYATQSGSHASAYSALSASLASLKNRLSARGVSLTSPDHSSQGSIYSTGANSYSLNDAQPVSGQAQSQPAYLSVTNQQDQQSVGYGPSHHGSGADNKTIVLAIPAKINFLTENRSISSSKVQQQPQQQLTVLQPSSEQQAHTEYSGKQLGLVNAHEGSVVDQSGQIVARDADHEHQQQYVIVNSPQQSSESPQLVATNSGSVPTQLYTNVYPHTVQQSNLPYTVKYVPTYQQTVQATPTAPKLYATSGSPSESVSNQESAVHESTSASRYTSPCPETCNPNDSRWRKYSVSKYKSCCSRSAQYDPQFDHPSSDKVSEASFRYADDSYYSYLYRKSRARRSRKPYRSNRYYKHQIAPAAHEDDSPVSETGSADTASRPYRPYDTSYSKYYKSRQQPQHESGEVGKEASLDSNTTGSGRYSKERSYRRGRARDYEASELTPGTESAEEESSYPESATRGSTGYGSGEFSVEAGRYPPEARNPSDEEDSRAAYEEVSDVDSVKQVEPSEYNAEAPYETSEEGDGESLTGLKKYNGHRRRKIGKGRSRKSKDTYGKQTKRSRRNRYKQEHGSQANGTDYDAVQSDEQYHPEQNTPVEDEQAVQKESPVVDNVDIDKDLTSGKYKQNYNDSATANLSKTTMHLKEILSLLEKKAQLKLNESNSAYLNQPQQPQQVTSTPLPPITTTSLYSPSLFRSQYDSISSNPSLQSAFSGSDYLGSDFSLKNPYRFDASSLSSSLASPSLSSAPSSFSSLSSDLYNPLLSYVPRDYSLPSPRHPSIAGGPPRKRRVNKNRYNHMMLPKPAHTAGASSYLSGPAGKSALLSSYYALNYPYLYRGNSPSVTTSYPYKNLNKNPYASLLSSKLAGSSGFYSDESRIHSLTYDPISSVASSLRPSSAMRMRSKPFVFNPHVMPIYTRHALLSQPLDVKK